MTYRYSPAKKFLIELYRKIIRFGVFNGTSLSNMYFAAKECSVGQRMIGFDAFQGFNELLESNPHLRAKEIGTYKINSMTFLITCR